MSKYVGKIITNQAPAGYSVAFDGTGDYLIVPDNTALEFGSSDFTIEAWFYFAGTANSTNAIVQKGGTGTSNLEYFLNVRPNSSVIEFSFSTNGTTLTTRTSSSVTIAQNTWHHVAVARTSATLYFFLNGVSAGTAALSSTLFAGNADLGIGASGTGSNIFAAGYISNLRILKGTALYTTAFTPPTQLFPITNTSLLTCQSPSIVDNSSNAFAITTNGNAAVSTFTPFAAYNPAPTTANPLVPAPGVWTLDEALQYTQQGVWPSPAANAIEDVFSTWLYTGNGSTQTITNGISIGDTAQANTSNTTASSIRAGSSLANFFSSGSSGIFNSFSAGEYLATDYGTSVSITTVTYKNSVGSDWAPTSVLVQYSSDNINWTTAATYSDDGSTNLQTITVSSGSGRYWRMYQNSNTRQNSAGYEWHLNSFTMRNSDAKGGLVWIKNRSGVADHALTDTARGVGRDLISNSTSPQGILANGLTSFNSNGFSVGTLAKVNSSGQTFASWTFREQAKFFDVVTFTAQSSGTQTINHNLMSAPGCMILKSISDTDNWVVYHRTLTSTQYLTLNTTSAVSTQTNMWPSVTSTSFDVSIGNTVTASRTYVAYLFAHDAGGFGPAGTDNVISCGSFTTDGGISFTAVNLGYEPQWLLIKASSGTSNWTIVDNMRGIPVGSNGARLIANLSDAETSTFSWANLTATGFSMPTGGTNPYGPSTTYIYIAIRRGPMRPPTTGTSVFSTSTYSPNTGTITSGFPTDFIMTLDRATGTAPWNRGFADRLRGRFLTLSSAATSAETNNSSTTSFDSNTGTILNGGSVYGSSYVYEQFRRAPGFFDVVCYTGTGVTDRVVAHNLTIPPQLIITKSRSSADAWAVGTSFGVSSYQWLYLNLTNSALSLNYSAKSRINSQPTSTQYVIATDSEINGSGNNYVAYLFATVGGVSKVGSYTGTGTTQQINCGFTNGSRFVMIKRTDSTGAWYVWDSARGIVAGNDPYLLLNSTAAEVTNTDYVDTYSLGFELSSTAPADLNASGGKYIFLAIA